MVIEPSREALLTLEKGGVYSKVYLSEPKDLGYGYLNRLRRLLRLRRDHFETLNDQGLRLLDRSIFSAYCDCLDIGEVDQARNILRNMEFTIQFTHQNPR